ncbi:MAG: thymidine kinase [Crocinitomicaceae bacterium]|nr:thymidine kinase [Crocinitomicaceae bacterium]MBB79048.1 thymidine kinase [Crocinitomicaceae bacterium]|tara:strand:+ start:4299 stop:4874 length:576 start_codon:yes stop_codon:yes gene_type:complete
MLLEQFPDESRSHGWIEVICGSMFSGKTEELIRRVKRAKIANQKILLIKPKIDERYHKKNVVSHQGKSLKAISVKKASEIITIWKGEKVVAIDETQFFDNGIINVCNELSKDGVRVIIAGLDMDFKGMPFGPMPELLSIAEYVTKVHAICMSCGNLAQFSHRKIKSDEQVLIGAVEEYKPLCRLCYNKNRT